MAYAPSWGTKNFAKRYWVLTPRILISKTVEPRKSNNNINNQQQQQTGEMYSTNKIYVTIFKYFSVFHLQNKTLQIMLKTSLRLKVSTKMYRVGEAYAYQWYLLS